MSKGTILLVDDDPAILRGLKRILEREGYAVEAVTAADKALSLLGRQLFDLVITDLMMPGMDGLTLLAEIKKRSPHTPVVMLTGHGSMEVVVQALRRGVSDFVTKPYRPEELLHIVRREVAQHRRSVPPGMADSFGLQLRAEQYDRIAALMGELRAEIHARCVLLIDANGSVIVAKGALEDINISALGALVAGDLAAASGIAGLLGEEKAFHINYHEGETYRIYSGQVVPGVFLLVVFGQEVKMGAVLYYTKATMAALRPILEPVVMRSRPPKPAASAATPPAEVSPATPEQETVPLVQEPELFSFEELRNSGVLDEDLIASLEKRFSDMWVSDPDV